jgi:hypothetical protein
MSPFRHQLPHLLYAPSTHLGIHNTGRKKAEIEAIDVMAYKSIASKEHAPPFRARPQPIG